MSAPIVHFEIGSTNSAELAKFYERMLGWKYMQAGAAAVIDDGGAGGGRRACPTRLGIHRTITF